MWGGGGGGGGDAGHEHEAHRKSNLERSGMAHCREGGEYDEAAHGMERHDVSSHQSFGEKAVKTYGVD